MSTQPRNKSRMSFKSQPREPSRNWPAIVFGAAIMIIAIVGIFHPQFSYSVGHSYSQVGPEKILFETRRIFRIPLWCSIPIATIGAALLLSGTRKA